MATCLRYYLRDQVLAEWGQQGVHVKYNATTQTWFIYEDGAYQEQAELDGKVSVRVKKLTEETLEKLGYEASENLLSQVVNKLSRRDEIIVTDLDIDPYLLPVGNGVLNLQSMTLLEAGSETFVPRRTPVNYDPLEFCPNFERALERMLPDETLRATVQEFMGYALTGDASIQKALYVKGPGGTGKGTLMRVIEKLLGGTGNSGFVTGLNIADFRDSSPALVTTVGKRLICVSEVSSRADLEGFKKATGQDTVMVNPKYKTPFALRITAKVIITGNTWIHTGDDQTNNSIDRRLITIPFTVNQAETENIPDIEKILEAELSGILNWCLIGLQRLRANGNRFTSDGCPESRLEMLSDSNRAIDFLHDEHRNIAAEKIGANDLYRQYRTWAFENGYGALGSKTFHRCVEDACRALGWKVEKKRQSKGYFYLGIGYR